MLINYENSYKLHKNLKSAKKLYQMLSNKL